MAIICNASQATWYLTCKDGKWVGQPGNCSAPDNNANSAQPSGGGSSGFSKGSISCPGVVVLLCCSGSSG